MSERIKIISGSSHPEFAQKICKCLNLELTQTETIRFSNGNLMVKILESVREADVFVIQTSSPPVNDHLIELFLLLDALRHSSANRITAVLPYFPYVRSDKKDQPRISIAARLVADLLQTSGANRILTMDLHSPQIQGFFHIPCDQLLANRIFCPYLKQQDLKDHVIVAADVGEAKHLGSYANKLHLPLAIIDKRRIGNSNKVIPQNLIGEIRGKHALIIDDEVSSGSTLFAAAQFLKSKGAKSVKACIVHPLFNDDAMQKLDESIIETVYITNSLPLEHHPVISDKIHQLCVAEFFAKAMECIIYGRSVSDLL